MEAASQRELLNFKIKHLRDQRQNLQVVLDDHIKKIVSIGQAWLEGKREDDCGKTLSFREISLLMEDTAFLMVEKCQDLRGDGEVSTSSSLDSAPVTSLETVPSIQVPSDTCKSMLTRIQVLEEAISSLSTSTRKLSENQSQTNTFMENVTTKQSEMDEQQKRSSKETEEHLKQLIYKQTKTDTEQNQQFESLQHQLHALEKAQSEMKEEILRSNKTTKLEASVESLKREVNKQKEDFHSLKVCVDEKLMKKVEDIAQKVTKQEKAGKKFDKVGQKLEELEEFGKQNLGKINAVEKKVERQKIKLENFEAVERQRENALESVKEKIEQLEASSMSMASKVEDQESSIQEVTKTLERQAHTSENQESALQQLTSTVESHSETLESYSVNREREIERVREVQDRLTVLETQKTEALKEVGKQFADVKQKYEMVCEMVDDRVLPLERLKEILNGKIKGREENVEKLHAVIEEVADLVLKVSQLDARYKSNLENAQAVEHQRQNALQSVKKRIDQLEALSISLVSAVEDQDSSIQKVTKTLGAQSHTLKNKESSLQVLTKTVQGHSKTLEGYSVNREKEIERMREVQDRLTVLERAKTETLEEMEKQFADVKQKYEMVCEMVDDRVLPLESLRDSQWEENATILNEAIKDIAVLFLSMSQLERYIVRPFVAFTAYACGMELVPQDIITSWTCDAGNIEGHFDENTGMFTAPLDGVYAVCLTMWQEEKGEIILRVYQTLSGNNLDSDSDETVLESSTKRDKNSDNDLILVDMRAGDMLYVYAHKIVQVPELFVSKFSVFLVN